MSVLNITGFETGDASEASAGVINGTASFSTTTTRGAWSIYSLRCNPTTTATGLFNLSTQGATGAAANLASNTDRYLRFYFNYATKPAANSEIICNITSMAGRGSTILEIRLDSTGVLLAYATTTLLATGATVLSSGTWYMIEVKRLLGTTAVWEVKIDGVSEISGTKNFGATTGTGNINLGKVANRNGNTVDFFYDDVCLSDSAYPGAGRCSILVPNANGNYQTWSIGAGSGSHYQVVDEVPPNGDTDYLLSTLVIGDAETEALTDTATAGISGTIACVKSVGIFKRDSVTNGSVRLRTRSGSTDTDTASDYATTSAYALIAKLFATDPATSVAWTTSGLDGLETGGISESISLASRMTFTAAMVDYLPAAPAVGGFNPAWARQSNILIGGEAL